MRRLHLFELEDFPWFPAVLRDGGTAYLRFAARMLGHGAALAPTLAGSLRRTGERRLVDLCSGGAGPVPDVVEALATEGLEVEALLTDAHPNLPAFERVAAESPAVQAWPEPVDATRVPQELQGHRTLFNALHHFRPQDARRILAAAQRDRQPLSAFELVERSPVALLGMLFAPLAVLLVMPFVRPLRPSWLLFTYLIPAIPLLVLWDGMVSCLRVYSVDELNELVDGIEDGPARDAAASSYVWRAGRIPLPGPVPAQATYLLGEPAPAAPAAEGSPATASDAR